MTTKLPTEIEALAYQAVNGELAWHSSHIWAAIDAIQHANLAILGGEVWTVVSGKMNPLPLLERGGTAVIAWDTEERLPDEPWQDYVQRAASQTRASIRALGAEAAIAKDFRDSVYYNFCYTSESGPC